jgi:hypothetical protein
MLHHVPARAGQDQLLAGLVQVVHPGGVIVGADSLAIDGLRDFHEDDTYNPRPARAPARAVARAGLRRGHCPGRPGNDLPGP